MEEVDQIARTPNSIPISCSVNLNLDGLLEKIWDMMALVGRRSAHGSAAAGRCIPARPWQACIRVAACLLTCGVDQIPGLHPLLAESCAPCPAARCPGARVHQEGGPQA